MGRFRVAAVLLLLCLVVLTGCATAAQNAAQSQATQAASLAKIGETVNQKGLALTVKAVSDPAPVAPGGVGVPAEGTRWVALDIELQNVSGQAQSYDLTLYAVMTTTDFFQYHALKLGVVQPALTPTQVAASASQRGWLTFQVPVDKKPASFLYAPSDGSGIRMTVALVN